MKTAPCARTGSGQFHAISNCVLQNLGVSTAFHGMLICVSPFQVLRSSSWWLYSAATLTKDTWTANFIVVDSLEDAGGSVSQMATVVTEASIRGAESA